MRPKTESALITLDGPVDYQSSSAFRNNILARINEGSYEIVVDMRLVDFIDSSGMAVILFAMKNLKRLGGRLSLTNVQDGVRRSLSTARITDWVEVSGISSVDHAVRMALEETPRWSKVLKARSDPSCMREIRSRVALLLSSLPFNEEDIFDITLAMGEALGNAFDHGVCGCQDPIVLVSINVYVDRVIVEVVDKGCGFGDVNPENLPVHSDTRGRGIALMGMLADGVEIANGNTGRGTVVKLVKYFS